MSDKKEPKIDDLEKLIDAAIKDVEQAISLKKSEESSKEESSKKDESKKEDSMKKDESGYDSQAPEASQEEAPVEAAPAPEAHEQEEHIEDILSQLDIEDLHALGEALHAELESRSMPQDHDAAAPAQDASPDLAECEPAMKAEESKKEEEKKEESSKMEKSELDLAKEAVKKQESEIKDLQSAVIGMTELVEKMAKTPKRKAITGIAFIDRNDSLAKSEGQAPTEEEIKKKVSEISKDNKKLAALSKKEQDAVIDYLTTKKVTKEVLTLISK